MHYLPTRIFFADGALQAASVYLPALGKRALLVTGQHSALASGAQADLLMVLNTMQIGYVLYNQVEENPTLETVMSGAKIYQENACDFIIAIGGGSPIDAAKAMSLVVANHLSQEQIYQPALYKTNVPVVAIPTTSGTGTEVTPYAVLTDAAQHKKAGFGSELAYPAISILDPRYTISMSESVTLHTGIDALSHLLEGIYSNKRNALFYPIIFEGIRLIITHLKQAISHPDDLAARTALMHASLYGGLAIAHTSTTLQHSIGYPLTSIYGVPHGLANGIVMQSMMELYYPAVKQELDALFAFLELTKNEFYAWLDSLQMDARLSLSEEFIFCKIPEVISSRNMANNPFEVSAQQIRELYKSLNR